AVYEEKNRGLDSPGRRAYEAFLKALFPKHGYGRPTLGEIEHLKSPAYQDMEAFFARYYTPGNMAILLAGDVDASVLPLLEQEFGQFKRPAGDANDNGPLPPIAGRTQVEVQVPSNEGVMLGWHLVSATAKDRAALELMDLLLLDGKSGILARELLITQKVANAGSGPTFMRESGYFNLYADALDGQSHGDLEKLLLGLVGKLQRGEFTDSDLATAILIAELNKQQQLESNEGRMQMLEEAFLVGEDWATVVDRIAQFKKVTRDDIVRVAKQYLTNNFVVVKKVKGTATPPKITKPGITAVKLDPSRRGAFAKSILDMPVSPIEAVSLKVGADYERSTLPTGDLVTVKNTRNGLFSITYQFDHGRTDERLVCLALEVLQVSGAGKRSPEQVARHLHELGLTVDTSCAKSYSYITISGIDRNLEAGMTLLREWLADPALDETIVKARVAAALTERANAIKSPQTISGAQAAYARFGPDSDYLVVATNKELQAATPAQLKASINKFLHRKHRTAYFGPRSQTEASAVIALGDGKVPTKARVATKFRKPNALFVTDQETAQTHVWAIWPRKSANDVDRAAGTLFGEYIQPILYQEVREARGLAYTVFGGFSAGGKKLDDASVFVYTGTQGDKTHDAVDAILSTLRQGVDESRLAQAKEAIGQSHRVERIAPRAIATTVFQWQDEGEKADPRAARTQRTLAFDKAALDKWMKGALGAPVIVSIVGDKKKLDDVKLKKLAPITVVPVTKLFGY
ncbi:MAG: insulinase family protein, partial [Deltaproteobacteria bacterium]|nr:insulinase family protein [Deltaproteobacteria bacterium]